MAHAPIGMILSAGFGTRLAPLTHLRPKPALELFGQPILFWLIKMLEKAGINDIFINLHYQPEQVVKALARCDIKARIHYSYEKEILGTAGALNKVLNEYGIADRKMLLLHGDIVCDVDLGQLLKTDDFCNLLCAKDREISGYQGSVASNKAGQIIELGRFYKNEQQPQSRGFFTGIHCLSGEALALIKNDSRNDLVGQIYPAWLKENKNIKAIMKDIQYDDLGSVKRLFMANMAINSSSFYKSFLTEFGSESLFIHSEAKVDKSAKFFGNVLIQSGSEIGANVQLGPNAIIGKNCLVKEGALIKNSVVISDTVVEKDERIDCMIGLSSARVKVKS